MWREFFEPPLDLNIASHSPVTLTHQNQLVWISEVRSGEPYPLGNTGNRVICQLQFLEQCSICTPRTEIATRLFPVHYKLCLSFWKFPNLQITIENLHSFYKNIETNRLGYKSAQQYAFCIIELGKGSWAYDRKYLCVGEEDFLQIPHKVVSSASPPPILFLSLFTSTFPPWHMLPT